VVPEAGGVNLVYPVGAVKSKAYSAFDGENVLQFRQNLFSKLADEEIGLVRNRHFVITYGICDVQLHS
jgi:hypothetical protein